MDSSFIYMFFFIAILGFSCCSNAGEINKRTSTSDQKNNSETATFAGGCFWCTQSDFEKLPGVIKVVSGYSGGSGDNPTYDNYYKTGYVEAVQIIYDPEIISYDQLVDYFLKHIDPTDPGGQMYDRGPHYRTVVFFHNEQQRLIAERLKSDLDNSKRFNKPIVTEITKFKNFTKAEDYHQQYCKVNPVQYNNYRTGSGRDIFLKKIWGTEMDKIKPRENKNYKKPDDKVLKKELTTLQYKVTQECSTEPPFNNEYYNNRREGIYVDIVTGEPLFSSKDKFDSGTGWPSFTKPLVSENIIESIDNSLFMKRTEVKSRHGKSHLGHVFPDGPGPTGLRYCINSSSIRFIPREELVKEGYAEFLRLFEKK